VGLLDARLHDAAASLQFGELWGTALGRRSGWARAIRATRLPCVEASDKSFVIAAGPMALATRCATSSAVPRSRKMPVRHGGSARDQEPALSALLQPIFRQRTAAEWLSLFDRAACPALRVYDMQSLRDVHVKQSGILCSLVLREPARPVVGNPLRMTDYSSR